MDPTIQSMVAAAAGTGAPTNPSSRYYGAAVEYYTGANGVRVAYLQRRIIPQASTYTSLKNYSVNDGDRLELQALHRVHGAGPDGLRAATAA